MNKISAVYQIENIITGDKYVGSSQDVKRRWANHKSPSTWKDKPNSLLYKDFKRYGLENFRFQILAPVMPEHLKEVEQEFIDSLHPTYNNYRANGLDMKRYREYQKEYHQTDKWKEVQKESKKKYHSQLCSYNGEILTLNTLSQRFYRAGIKRPVFEAKKYLK